MSARKIVLVLNATAGVRKQAKREEAVSAAFERQGLVPECHVAHHGANIAALAADAVRNGATIVVAGGGDGTMNSVASALLDTDCAMGVLPLGTLNHFAKDLGIPLDIDGAVKTIAGGIERRIDVGEVNGDVFVNNSSLGLYPMIVRGREQIQRLGRGKWTALFWSALAVLRRYPTLIVTLRTPERGEFRRHTPLVFISNNHYEMNGFRVGSRVALDRGSLGVYLAHADGRGHFLWLGIRAAFGLLRHGVDFDMLSTDRVEIGCTRRSIHVSTDGEVASLTPPLRYRIRPGALRVIVPAAS